eukprot:6418168-Amphidinium_carterae.1
MKGLGFNLCLVSVSGLLVLASQALYKARATCKASIIPLSQVPAMQDMLDEDHTHWKLSPPSLFLIAAVGSAWEVFKTIA